AHEAFARERPGVDRLPRDFIHARVFPHARARHRIPFEDAETGRARRDAQPLVALLTRGERPVALAQRRADPLVLLVEQLADRAVYRRAEKAFDNLMRAGLLGARRQRVREVFAHDVLHADLQQIEFAIELVELVAVHPALARVLAR